MISTWILGEYCVYLQSKLFVKEKLKCQWTRSDQNTFLWNAPFNFYFSVCLPFLKGWASASFASLEMDGSQCPRTDLNKRFLPRPKTITAWKLPLYRSKISKNWNPPRWVPLHRFFKNWFLLIQKQLYNNYIQTHFTK